MFCGHRERKFCSQRCFHLYPMSQQTRQKISQCGIGRVQSEETKKKRAEKHRGMKRDPSVGRNISKANTGRVFSEEHRQKLRGPRPAISGDKNYQWIKDRDSYAARCKLIGMMRCMLLRTLKQIGGKKENHTCEQLGYSPEQLKLHLEQLFLSGMTWKNHGKGEGTWQIDHKKPIVAFNKEISVSEINSLQNLQPLWFKDNLRKGKKY